MRVDPEAPRSAAWGHVGSCASRTRRTWKRSPHGLQPQIDDSQVHLSATWVLHPVKDGER